MDSKELALEPCPFCGSTDHLTMAAVGSLTSDMPSRPYRVACHHIDHDQVHGPVAYGRGEAITAWNTRAQPTEEQVERAARAIDPEAFAPETIAECDYPVAKKRLIERQGKAFTAARAALAAAIGGRDDG